MTEEGGPLLEADLAVLIDVEGLKELINLGAVDAAPCRTRLADARQSATLLGDRDELVTFDDAVAVYVESAEYLSGRGDRLFAAFLESSLLLCWQILNLHGFVSTLFFACLGDS